MSEKFARAIENGNVEKVISLIEKRTVSVHSRMPRYYNPSALQHAAFYKQAAIVQILLQNGACIDDVNDQGMTACHFAAHFTPGIDSKTDMIDTVRQLLSYQPNLSLKDVAGRTSLQYSFESENNEDISMMLLKAGAPHASLPEQYLCYFASTGTEAIQILHERGVVIRDLRCDEFNETALHLCIRDKRGDAVAKMLVDVGGIDIEARDVRRNSCLQFASIYGNFDALSWLIGAGNAAFDNWSNQALASYPAGVVTPSTTPDFAAASGNQFFTIPNVATTVAATTTTAPVSTTGSTSTASTNTTTTNPIAATSTTTTTGGQSSTTTTNTVAGGSDSDSSAPTSGDATTSTTTVDGASGSTTVGGSTAGTGADTTADSMSIVANLMIVLILSLVTIA
jgi:ankyrin repeat protein